MPGLFYTSHHQGSAPSPTLAPGTLAFCAAHSRARGATVYLLPLSPPFSPFLIFIRFGHQSGLLSGPGPGRSLQVELGVGARMRPLPGSVDHPWDPHASCGVPSGAQCGAWVGARFLDSCSDWLGSRLGLGSPSWFTRWVLQPFLGPTMEKKF